MDSQSNESRLRLAEEALQKNGFKKVDDVWVAPSAYSHEMTAEAIQRAKASAVKEWNHRADSMNQWEALARDAQDTLFAKAIAAAVHQEMAMSVAREAVFVKWQHKAPICDIKGDCIGYTDWIDGNAKLKAWPSRALYTAPPGVSEVVPYGWVNAGTERQQTDNAALSVGPENPWVHWANAFPVYITPFAAPVADNLTSTLMEYFNASVAFNNSQGDGPEGESLSEAVERSNKAEARFEAATQAAHIAMRAHLKTGAV